MAYSAPHKGQDSILPRRERRDSSVPSDPPPDVFNGLSDGATVSGTVGGSIAADVEGFSVLASVAIIVFLSSALADFDF